AEGRNVFASDADPRGCGLDERGYHFIGGILDHADASCAVIAPTVNSYKRLVKQGSMSGSTWAPVFACYGDNNRTNMLRIPTGGGRVECRAADSAVNPYLAAAMLFAAGLEGIRAERDPGAPNHENMYEIDDTILRERGIRQLPDSLGSAIAAFAVDELAQATFGPDMHASYCAYKQGEWTSYHNHVSQWERDRYLRFF
ncbi:MAG: type III glutamate--ammonia ligase, partial [Planctomycetota bacterium]